MRLPSHVVRVVKVAAVVVVVHLWEGTTAVVRSQSEQRVPRGALDTAERTGCFIDFCYGLGIIGGIWLLILFDYSIAARNEDAFY